MRKLSRRVALILRAVPGAQDESPGFSDKLYVYDANDRLLTESERPAQNAIVTRTTQYVYFGLTPTVPGGPGRRLTCVTATGASPSKSAYSYETRGRQTSFTINGAATTYTYNDANLRASRTESGAVTKFLLDTANPTGYAQVLEEWKQNSLPNPPTLDRSYLLGMDVINQAVGAATPRYFFYDARGSMRALVNSFGAIITGQSFN